VREGPRDEWVGLGGGGRGGGGVSRVNDSALVMSEAPPGGGGKEMGMRGEGVRKGRVAHLGKGWGLV